MSLLTSAVRQAHRSSPVTAAPEIQPKRELGAQDQEKAQWRWRRLTQKVLVMVRAAQARVKAMLMLSEEARFKEKQAMHHQGPDLHIQRLGCLRVVGDFVLGKRLPSQSSGVFEHQESACPHDPSMARLRGGRGHPWCTCLQCGARWMRWQLHEVRGPSSDSTSAAKSG